MQKLAIYDMDRTITKSGTYTPFLIFVAKSHAPWRLLLAPLALIFLAVYGIRLISRERLKELNLALLIGPKFAQADIQPLIDEYAKRVIRDNSYPGALEQIETDRKAGYRVVLATASYHLYVDAIAELLEIRDVIATELEVSNGIVHARIRGENCYYEAKLRKIRAWMAVHGIERETQEIRAYSDHISDVPMLEFADTPFVTTPSLPLRLAAEKKGWHIYDWDK